MNCTTRCLLGALVLSSVIGCGGPPPKPAVDAPEVLEVIPTSPSNENKPRVKGKAPSGTTVTLYSDASCKQEAGAKGSSTVFGTGGIPVNVGDNSSTRFFATATADDGRVSDCSKTSVTYVEDSAAPEAPTLGGTTPPSPGSATDITVAGTAEAGALIHLYGDGDCVTALGEPVTAATDGTFSLAVQVAPGSTTAFRATATDAAGNRSECSTSSITYEHDTGPVAIPVITGTSPASPSSQNEPLVNGTSVEGLTVKIYPTADCSGTALNGMVIDASGAFSIPVVLAEDATTTLHAQAENAMGKKSTCSSGVPYVEDSTAPAAPTALLTAPASPSNVNDVQVSGNAEAQSDVLVFTSSGCTGTPAGTTTADAAGTFTVQVTVAADTTTTFYAQSRDAAGNASACSTDSVTYIEDSSAPAEPAGLATSPASPANDNNPAVTGTAEPGAMVELFTNATCTGAAAASGAATSTGDFSITVAVGDDTTTTFYARAVDAAGNPSACSTASVVYVEDSAAPTLPVVTGTTPSSPSGNNNPVVNGTTEALAAVAIFDNAACTGTPVGSGAADATGAFNVSVTVAADATTTLYAQAMDGAGNASGCSTSFATYTEDSTPPAEPALTGTTPASPSSDGAPSVQGTAEANALVSVYDNATCAGTPLATTTADGTGAFAVTVNVAADASTTLYATAADGAGNVSACSTSSLTYVEDSTAPAAPVLASSNPPSPANHNTPTLNGTAEASATVQLFTNATCSGTPADTTTASSAGAFSFTVTVTDNSTTTFYALALDAAGNTSPCSAGLTYEENSTIPQTPVFSGSTPASPANENAPTLSGTAAAGQTVSVFTDATCSGTAVATAVADVNGTFSVAVTVADDTSTTYYASSEDAAGNISPCSAGFTYVEDSTAPAAPTLTGTTPASPANDNSPTFDGTAEAGANIGLFAGSTCAGTAVATGTADATGAFSVAVTVTDDSSTTLYAAAVDAAGNVSGCSTTPITYVEDSTAPAMPVVTGTTPASPSNDDTPTVNGTADALALVSIFSNASCTGTALGSATANASGAFAAQVTVPADSTTTLYARASDAAGNLSGCSTTSVTYVEDSTAPSMPSALATAPASPANDNAPTVSGTTSPGAQVNLFTNATCSGAPAASGTANASGDFSIGVSVANDSTTTFYAQASDAAGNASACSTNSVTYVEDSTAPAAPSALSSAPTSPANENNPSITGSAEAAASVALFTNAGCTGTAVASGTANASGAFSIPVTVADDSTTTYYARATDAAGNASACSTSSATYVEDSTAPALPTVSSTTPASPSNDNNPSVNGTAEANAVVSIYSDAACTSAVLGSGAASGAGAYSVPVTVPADATTTLYARAEDAAGNASGCSTTSVTYIEDSTPPALPSGLATTPASPANNNNPSVTGSTDAMASVALFTNAACSGSAIATGTADGAGTFTIPVTVANDTTTTFYAQATDAVGNASACSTSSVTYVEDSTAPAAPASLATAPASPANNNNPSVTGSAEAGAAVAIFTNATCSGSPTASGTASGSGTFSVAVAVADNTTTTFYARATDAAGNASACSTSSTTYVEDSDAPTAPTVASTTPASPANNNNPSVSGTAEANSTVAVFDNATCTSPALGSTTASGAGNFSVPISVADDTSTTLYAQATDPSGNDSPCSTTSVTYVEDSTGPVAPAALTATPSSPANDNAPVIAGTTEAAASVTLFASATCTGTPLGTGTADAAGDFSITVMVADDTTTTVYAQATDAAGNATCSTASVTYVEDSSAPALPVVSSTTPLSPASDNNPSVTGTAEPNSTVHIHTTSGCTGSVGSGTADGSGAFSVSVAVLDDTTTTFYAQAIDGAGNVSGCSTTSVTYVEDSTAPGVPSVSGVAPAPTANDNDPVVSGSADANVFVDVYTDAACTTAALNGSGQPAFGNSDGTGAWSVTVRVADDSTTDFYASARDAAGNISGCSATSVTYVEDSTPPATPTITATVPATSATAPANDNNPVVEGTADATMAVEIFSDSACATAAIGTGTANAAGQFSITVTVADDVTTTLYARSDDGVGNVSPCSATGFAYYEDSTAPTAPTLTGTTPSTTAATPQDNNSPAVNGTAEPDSTVDLFTNNTCSGVPVETGIADPTGEFSINVTVADDSTTSFWAAATDAANNTSPCSAAEVTYHEDSTAPGAPSVTTLTPASPANDNTPDVSGTAEANSTIVLYTDAACTTAAGSTGTADASGNFTVAASVADDTTTSFYATAIDYAGNVSACSATFVTYVEDSTAPAEPVVSAVSPLSPGSNTAPSVSGTAEANATVRTYSDGACSDLRGTGAADGSGNYSVTSTATANSTTTFYAQAQDAAGNVSPCSTTSVAYLHDDPAAVDVTFDADGWATLDTGLPWNDYGRAVAVSTSGAVAVAGYSNDGTLDRAMVMKFDANGAPDTTFNTTGFFRSADNDTRWNAVALQSDGKVVVAGRTGATPDTYLCRFTTAGALDSSFGTGGCVVDPISPAAADEAHGLAIQADGKIVVVGYRTATLTTDAYAARYTASGARDTTFNATGLYTRVPTSVAKAYAVTIDGSGRIVMAGQMGSAANFDFYVERISAGGAVDATFGSGGYAQFDMSGDSDEARALAIAPDGRIVVAGQAGSSTSVNFGVARLTSLGALDTGFDADGKVVTDPLGGHDRAFGVGVQSDGRIVVAGANANDQQFVVARFTTAGALDVTFDADGVALHSLGDRSSAYALQLWENKIVAAGTSRSSSTADYDAAVLRILQ